MNEHEKLSTEPYKGVRDFYPEDWAPLQSAFDTIRRTLRLWGYEEYNASPLERAEIYESKTSEEIVNEQTYTFTDRGDRQVTLRPEMTPTFARMVARKRRELPLPIRWFSIPNVFRYERPQRGRMREHYQLNVDLAGLEDSRADGEIVLIAAEVLKALGAKKDDFIIRVSSRTLLAAACKAAGFDTEEAVRQYSRLLDRKSKMPHAEYEAALAGRGDPLQEIERAEDPAVAEEKAKLGRVILDYGIRSGAKIEFDASIVRGFDYYTGMVFEVYDTNAENPRSLFGGGRYDGLVSMFGAEAIPCVGFGMGDVTLMDFLATHDIVPAASSAPALYIGTPPGADYASAEALADELRRAGVPTLVTDNAAKGLGDQVKEAVRRDIPYFAAFGANEAASGMLKLKDLAASSESEVSRADLPSRILG